MGIAVERRAFRSATRIYLVKEEVLGMPRMLDPDVADRRRFRE
jgi:hypothetical protein